MCKNMCSGSFKNLIDKLCLQITYSIYMKKQLFYTNTFIRSKLYPSRFVVSLKNFEQWARIMSSV